MAISRSISEVAVNDRRAEEQRHEDDLKAQIAQLQADLKGIATSLAALAEDKVAGARHEVKQDVAEIAKAGQKKIDEVQDEFSDLEKQLKDTIREKPLTAVAGAIALGFILAVVSR
jgi:ElaB/YqjD/DUF883 family membrane-anchored ribosome-binding protein